MSVAALLAGVAAIAAVLGAWEALIAAERVSPAPALARLWRPLRLARQQGRRATDSERRRLAVVSAAVLLGAGWLAAGSAAGALAGLAGPALAIVVLRARRRRYAEELRGAAAEVARALADAVAAGHSARGALVAAAPGLDGAAGRELRALAAALALGTTTEAGLERVRRRARCAAWDALVAAVLIQREAGGDLVSLLRRLASSLEAAARLDAEARTATAQARFTAWLVIALPFGAAGLGELGSPGMIAGLLAHPLSAWLAIAAITLQVIAVVCVGRIARVPASG